MTATPAFLKDTQEVLSAQGFATGNIWYHGTSSALVGSIQEQGLKGSGDQAILEATKKTMATIGNSYTETQEPVFLTPSKELAYYWAQQTVRNRQMRIQGEEAAVVLEVNLPDELNQQVKPDVGAASLLLLKEGENYLAYLASLYQANGLELPQINLMKAERTDYLKLLGMAYSDQDIPAEYIRLLAE
ncbi:hypothetical protein SAMN05660443_1315 [Marinospirillum celere]|uniref:Uncharacterized protein n=1 Tax=Marinospirillum celere TaxID=1122252 RepID=A0A1I1FZ45_9GAMM|nr:hypothetical protein [Marinospirillum celere]SFC04869.1 hypothetical protein SAMN05660443_1315 [Marinospirillum celere]